MRTAATRTQPGRARTAGARGDRFAVPLALAASSGAAALAHELLWTRRLIDLLGGSGESASRVFGCFFLGLALGAAWASRLASRVERPWRAAAMAEAAVAILALPALVLPSLTGWIWPALGPEGLTGPAGSSIKLLVSVLVILPPATAMGAVLPLLAAATLTGPRRLGRHGMWLYAANTLGGVVGIVATALLALPAVGAAGSMTLAMGANAVVAAGLWRLDRRPSSPRPPGGAEGARPESGTWHARALPWAVAFASGAGVLATEVLALEAVMLAAPLSFFAPAAILAATILLLGVAALFVPVLSTREGDGALLPTLLALAGVAVAATPILFMALASAAGNLAGSATLPGTLARIAGLALASLGPAILLAGLVFPLTLAQAGAEGARRQARRFGRLLAANGLGGVVGAEVAYRVILPSCGVHAGLAVVGLFYALAALGLALVTNRQGQAGVARPLAALMIIASLGLGWVRYLPVVNPHLGFRVLDQQFGREGAVAVIARGAEDRAILLSNQYVLGGTGVRWDQERQAHLPLLIHPQPRAVAFIGLATGITPGAALDHEPVRSVTAVELSPLVVRAADRFFGESNHGVTRDPRARVVVEDGRTYLAASPDRFDVVVGDLFLPWAPGEGRLFSVEHFRAVRRSLRPGGVFCQWLPMYQLTPGQFDLIAETFRRAFPRVHLIRNGFGVRQPLVGLVGFRDGDLDWATVSRRCGEARAGGSVLDPAARHPEVVGMLYLGRWAPHEPGGPINTLGNMSLELAAGRERITGEPGRKYVHGGLWLRWMEHRLASRDRPVPDGGPPGVLKLPGWMQLGLRISAWEQEHRQQSKGADLRGGSLPERLSGQLPPSMLADRRADWSRWPGTPPPSSALLPGLEEGLDRSPAPISIDATR